MGVHVMSLAIDRKHQWSDATNYAPYLYPTNPQFSGFLHFPFILKRVEEIKLTLYLCYVYFSF